MLVAGVEKLVEAIKPAIILKADGLEIADEEKLRETVIDNLVYNLTLNEDEAVRQACRWLIWEAAGRLEIYPASIQGLYSARANGGYSGMTVPAVNIRGMTYEVARALIKAALKNNSLAFIFEIAKSEIGYTFQRPAEYAGVCLAAAIKEKFSGPVFIQGDHFQAKAKNYQQDPSKEISGLRGLIKEAIEAGFYNIDIDSSTLVDLDQPTIEQQQENNFQVAAQLTAFIRRNEPEDITISVGGEIGEVGGKNSTP